MNLNPFSWFGQKVDKAYSGILAKADADMEHDKAATGRTWGNTDPVLHIVPPSSFVDYSIPKKRPMPTQSLDMDAWKAGIEARIAALEASIAAQPQEHSAKAQKVETDEELMKRFEVMVEKARSKGPSCCVFVGQRVFALVWRSSESLPMGRYGEVAYRGVVVYYLEHEAEYYIG